MSSPAIAETHAPSNITLAQSGDNRPLTNPDIQGYGIRLSTFISHLCVALLIAYSPKIKQRFYLPLISQSIFIIVAVWLSVVRNPLSLSDVEFVILQTRSPVSIYVLLLVIPRLFFQTSALKRTDVTPNSDGSRFFKPFRDMLDPQLDWALIRHRTWGLLYVIFCVGVNLTRHLGKAGYISLTFADPATPSLIQLDTRPDYKVWIGLLVCSALIYECVLHRHAAKRREIMHQLAGDRKTLLMVRPLSKRVRWGFTATWFLATKLHPWLPFFYASVMFLNWSMDMKIWTIENDFEWTYGQLLAVSQLTITLYPCVQLCSKHWREIVRLPHHLVFDIIWLISGRCRPWTDPDESNLILNSVWNAFPPDVTPTEIGLPIPYQESPATVLSTNTTNARNMPPRQRQSRTCRNRTRRRNRDPLEEEDIADGMMSNRGRLGPLTQIPIVP